MLLMEKPAEAARLCGLTRLTDTLHGRWIREMVFGQGDMTLLAHRGSYKTTCLSFAMAVMLVVYPRKNLLFLRKTDSDVLEVLRQVFHGADSVLQVHNVVGEDDVCVLAGH